MQLALMSKFKNTDSNDELIIYICAGSVPVYLINTDYVIKCRIPARPCPTGIIQAGGQAGFRFAQFASLFLYRH